MIGFSWLCVCVCTVMFVVYIFHIGSENSQMLAPNKKDIYPKHTIEYDYYSLSLYILQTHILCVHNKLCPVYIRNRFSPFQSSRTRRWNGKQWKMWKRTNSSAIEKVNSISILWNLHEKLSKQRMKIWSQKHFIRLCLPFEFPFLDYFFFSLFFSKNQSLF